MRGHPKQVCNAFFSLPNEQKMKRLLNRDDNACLSRLQDGGCCLLKCTEIIKPETDTGAEIYVLYSGLGILMQIFQSCERPSVGRLSTTAELLALLLFMPATSCIHIFTDYFQIVLQLYRCKMGHSLLSTEHEC